MTKRLLKTLPLIMLSAVLIVLSVLFITVLNPKSKTAQAVEATPFYWGIDNGTLTLSTVQSDGLTPTEFAYRPENPENPEKPNEKPNWNDVISTVTSVKVDENSGTIVLPGSVKGLFQGGTNITSIDLSKFDTSNVTDMSFMFYDCSNLASLDLSKFDTSNVTTMQAMFCRCKALVSLDLSNFDTANVTKMQTMFALCWQLTKVDLSSFDTANVTTMQAMFNGCKALVSLDLSNFNTANVTTMTSMFINCTNLIDVDLSSFDTANVTIMSSMFGSCSNLASLDLSNFDTANVTKMGSMFSSCRGLVSIDLSSFDISNLTTTTGVTLINSINLREIKTPKTMGNVTITLPRGETWYRIDSTGALSQVTVNSLDNTYADSTVYKHSSSDHRAENSCTAGGICVLCGQPFNALGHKYAEYGYTLDVRPTCTEKGIKSRHCVRCGEKEPDSEVEIPAWDSHNFAKTYSSDGEGHWHDCLRDGCTSTDAKAAHSGGTATCTKKAVCTACGAEYGELAAHVYDKEVAEEKYLKSEATTESKAIYYKSCVCGAKGEETFEYGEKLPEPTSDPTTDPGTKPEPAKKNVGAIVGGVVGGSILLLLIVYVVCYFAVYRRKSNKNKFLQVLYAPLDAMFAKE